MWVLVPFLFLTFSGLRLGSSALKLNIPLSTMWREDQHRPHKHVVDRKRVNEIIKTHRENSMQSLERCGHKPRNGNDGQKLGRRHGKDSSS